MKKVSIVVPCYNEEECISKFYERANDFLAKLEKYKFELIFVNDGSKDKTKDILENLAEKDERIKVINFSRNFGQQAAILCGYENAKGDCVIELDADMQDPIEIVDLMLTKWEDGFKVVHGKRKSRKKDSIFKKITAKVYYLMYNMLSKEKMVRDSGDFKLYDRVVIDHIVSLPERNKFLRGLASWVGYRQCEVEFDREKRNAGKTKYSLKKMIKLATDGIVSNSTIPLYIPFKIGMAGFTISTTCINVFVILAMCKIYLTLTAWLFPFTLLLASIVIMVNSVSNIYIDRIYTECKNRPDYIIEDTKNLDKN